MALAIVVRLQGRVPCHLSLLTHVLGGCAIDLGNYYILAVLVVVCQLAPCWRKLFAVA